MHNNNLFRVGQSTRQEPQCVGSKILTIYDYLLLNLQGIYIYSSTCFRNHLSNRKWVPIRPPLEDVKSKLKNTKTN